MTYRQRECRCGHTYHEHYESTDDGAGCTYCQACMHYEEELIDERDEREDCNASNG